jgi:hypothetical protein
MTGAVSTLWQDRVSVLISTNGGVTVPRIGHIGS